MQQRTSAARLTFLFVVAAIVLQAAPAWAMPAAGSKARVGIAAASRHSLERYTGRSAHLGAPSASDFAPGGHALFLIERAFEGPAELVALSLARGTHFTPATAPTAVRRLRE